MTRKLGMADGALFVALMREIAADAAESAALADLAAECARIGEWMHDAGLDDRLAGSVPFCTMSRCATTGWQLLHQIGQSRTSRPRSPRPSR
ncbi:MAG: hypothetical protein U5J82_02835 [Desulfobacterales bacterium]|nr:hypothetical protein [Desulfobacterales bacterium]